MSVCAERIALFCFLCLMFRGDTTQKQTGGTDLKHVVTRNPVPCQD